MASLLVAIGGTGQHMALAACRLMRLGALPRMRVVVVDADIHGDLTRRLQTFGETVQEPFTEHPAEGGVGLCPPFDLRAHADPAFQDLFQSPNPKEREIFETLFEESSAGIRVKEGFFGRPAVGVTVARKYQEAQLKPVLEAARLVGGNDGIFVTGSLTGGTGAGLIHDIAQSLKREAHVRMYGILYLRWFQMPSGAGVQTTISDSTLDRNMRFGIDYLFRETARHFHASLLLGIPERPPHDKLHPIQVYPGRTGELSHALHVVGAYGILKLVDIARTEQTGGALYAAALDDPVQLYEERWGDRPLAWYYNRAVWLREILLYAADKKFGNEVLSSFKRFLRTDPRNVGEGLHKALARYPDVQREVVLREMQETWGLLAQQYDFCVQWLDEVLGALPDRLQDARIRPKVDSLKEIQNHWQRNPIPEQEAPPPAWETARRFHDLLVGAF